MADMKNDSWFPAVNASVVRVLTVRQPHAHC
jgi:hypothetical protein